MKKKVPELIKHTSHTSTDTIDHDLCLHAATGNPVVMKETSGRNSESDPNEIGFFLIIHLI